MTDRHSNRCCNSEALARYEREVDKNEKIYDQKCDDMFEELNEALDMIAEIAKRYDLPDEAKEYVKDLL